MEILSLVLENDINNKPTENYNNSPQRIFIDHFLERFLVQVFDEKNLKENPKQILVIKSLFTLLENINKNFKLHLI